MAESKIHVVFPKSCFRGYDHGQPVLVTAQGTYADMYFQAWNPDMTSKWTLSIGENAPEPEAAIPFLL